MTHRVELTDHAKERGQSRLGLSRAKLAELVVADVRAALEAGRVAKSLPAGFRENGPRGRVAEGAGWRRIAWVEDASRAYVLARVRRPQHGGERTFVVLTVMVPRSADEWETAA